MKRGEVIFLTLSLVIIAIGTAIFLEASAFQKKARKTEGTVVSSNSTSYVVRYISDDGVERTHSAYQRKNGKYRDGEKFQVFYLIDNPDKSRISDGKKGGRTTIIFGIVLLALFLVSIYQRKSKGKSQNLFKTGGRKLQAEILGIETDLNTTVLEKHPYIINCKWVDPITGRAYTDSVRQLWKDPTGMLAGRNYLDVYIDRNDPEKYFLDSEFLDNIKA